MKLGEVRAIALAHPGALEADHWGNASFRICGRIFATVPDPGHLNVMIDPFDVEAVVKADPAPCSELGGVRRSEAPASTCKRPRASW